MVKVDALRTVIDGTPRKANVCLKSVCSLIETQVTATHEKPEWGDSRLLLTLI